MVSDKKGNPSQIEGIPVLTLSEMGPIGDCKILIAPPETYHGAIAESLCEFGVMKEQLIFVDNQLENTLMEAYYSSQQEFATVLEFLKNCKAEKRSWEITTQEVAVFQAKCHDAGVKT